MKNLKTSEEIELMRKSAQLVSRTLGMVAEIIEPGVSLLTLDKKAEEFIRDHGGIPSFKGYDNGFDNLVQVGHNVRIGRDCLLMAQVGVAGSVRIGDRVILAGQVGVNGHLRIGDGARIAAQSGVVGSVPAGEDYGGYPARRHREWLRSHAVLYGLAPLARELQALARERKAHG